MAGQTPALLEAPTLGARLSILYTRHGLPAGMSPADVLLGTTGWGYLEPVIDAAPGSDRAAGATLEEASSVLAAADQAVRKAVGAQTLRAATGGNPTPLRQRYVGRCGYSSKTTSCSRGRTAQAAARAFYDARQAHDLARATKQDTADEVALADAVRARRKELSRIPELIIVALSTLLMGGGSVYQTYTAQEHTSQRPAAVRAVGEDVIFMLTGFGAGEAAAIGLRNGISKRLAWRAVTRAQMQAIATGELPA